MGFDAWLNPVKETGLQIGANHRQIDLGLSGTAHEVKVLQPDGIGRTLLVQCLLSNRLSRILNCNKYVPFTERTLFGLL